MTAVIAIVSLLITTISSHSDEIDLSTKARSQSTS